MIQLLLVLLVVVSTLVAVIPSHRSRLGHESIPELPGVNGDLDIVSLGAGFTELHQGGDPPSKTVNFNQGVVRESLVRESVFKSGEEQPERLGLGGSPAAGDDFYGWEIRGGGGGEGGGGGGGGGGDGGGGEGVVSDNWLSHGF